jgi:hypothetical protein
MVRLAPIVAVIAVEFVKNKAELLLGEDPVD